MILSDRDIRAALQDPDPEKRIQIDPFDDKLIQPASCDLRVGTQAVSTSGRELMDLEKVGFIEINPGDFVIVTSYEKLALSAWHVARFGLTSSYARQGLIATTGMQIDPGFRGRLIVGLTNLSTRPIVLPCKDTFLSAEFHRLAQAVQTPYAGPYQDRDALAREDIQVVLDREYMSQTEIMRTLETLTNAVEGLKQSVGELRRSISWQFPLTMSLIAGILLVLVGLLFK